MIKDMLEFGNCILVEDDFKDVKNLYEYEVVISMSCIGRRDFDLVNRLTGDIIKIRNGKRVR